MMRDDDAEDAREIEPLPLSLGLLRVVDGYVKGSPHWVDPGSKEIEIGALALGDGDIATWERVFRPTTRVSCAKVRPGLCATLAPRTARKS